MTEKAQTNSREIFAKNPTLLRQINHLVFELRNLLNPKPTRDKELARDHLIISYWRVGEKILKEKIIIANVSQTELLNELARALGLERTTLARCIYFFRAYKSPPIHTNLSWSHYKELLAVKDDITRGELEALADKEKWSRVKLVHVIKKQKELEKEAKKFDLVSSATLMRPIAPTYLYKAQIVDIVDGDTLVLNIDLGFDCLRRQRIRLAGIDTAEITSERGQKAFEFVTEKLRSVEFVMIKTNKVDIYGRYVAHLFYDPENKKDKDKIFLEGNYLNGELLKEGLAVLY